MTKKEAIEWISKLIETMKEETSGQYPDPEYKDEVYEALDIAIETLEQEPTEDVVSRKAVLKTLNDMDNILNEDRTVENYKELLKECYKVLPPIRPQEQKDIR